MQTKLVPQLELSGQPYRDPLLFVAPALFAIAASVILMRVVPLIARMLAGRRCAFARRVAVSLAAADRPPAPGPHQRFDADHDLAESGHFCGVCGEDFGSVAVGLGVL